MAVAAAVVAATAVGAAVAARQVLAYRQAGAHARRARSLWRACGFSDLDHRREEVLLAIEMALHCGDAMARCDGKRREARYKDEGAKGGDAIDPVTETDEANERYVLEAIAKRFPSHSVIGEEACAAAGSIPPLGLEPTWIIDPIDGTQNFVHACPLSCVR